LESKQSAGYAAGIYWMLLATLCFSSLDATGKFLTQSYPVEQVVWARFVFHLLLVTLILGTRLPTTLRTRRIGLQLWRSGLMLATNALFFIAVKTLTLANVVAIMFLGPLFVTALSVPMLNERVGMRRWMAVLVGFCGALLIVQPSAGLLASVAMLPVIAALTNALYTISTRQLSMPGTARDGAATTLFYTALVGALVSSAIVPSVWVQPTATGWMMMIAIGVFGAFGHLAFIRALSVAPPVVIVPLSYGTLVWSTSLGFMVFGEVPDPMTIAGGAVIVASGLYVFHRERVRSADAGEDS
jgi:drug/metabolite transporter (DMT)-like permease